MRVPVLISLTGFIFGVSQADIGCTVDVALYGTEENNNENLPYALLARLYDTMGETITSECCSWTSITTAPLSVLIYAGVEAGYDTDAELAAVLDPWIGTYLRSGTDIPSYSTYYPYDYLVTNVTCD